MTATAAKPQPTTPAQDDIPDGGVATLQRIPLEQLRDSPLNPRQHYDEAALRELAASLKATGQLEAVLVRPIRGGQAARAAHAPPLYELAAGHRRFRAAKLAGLTHLEAKVQELDDRTFIEILNVSNLQRDDLHPLEEAQGFRDLMERAGYDVTKIAARVGRSEKYVYDRIKLLQLTPEAKRLFLAGEFEAGHAIILARLSPADQAAAIGSTPRNSYDPTGGGGLFELEEIDSQPGQPSLKLADKRKPRSVRELQDWVNNNVRFKPEELDPFLFPETAQLVTAAEEEELQVVHITHDYRIPDGAKDEKQRTYGRPSWKRAGTIEKPTCEYAALGVVVGGPGRGESFVVCVRKDKCKRHWAAEQKELARRRKTLTGSAARESFARRDAKYEAERQAREAEHARWKAALPTLYAALAEKIKATPVTPTSLIGKELRQAASGWISKEGARHCQPGRTLEDAMRFFVFASIDEQVFGSYDAEREIPRALKVWGIDARKIVDEVSPKVQTRAVKPTKKAKGT